MQKNNVLVLCHDVIGQKMAGPGIRYSNIAKQLKSVSNVTLAYFSDTTTNGTQAFSINRNGDDYKILFDKHDIIFAQWLSLDMLNYAKSKNIGIIFDLYAPVPIEYMASIEFSKANNKMMDAEFENILEVYKQYLINGDLFVCSNQRQKNFWVGYATSIGLLKPSDFSSENNIANKIILGPMGIEVSFKRTTALKLRKELGFKKNDFVLLWTGGIWDWFDACTIIRAVALTGKPDIKLVFLGTTHPNATIKEMSESFKARKLSDELGLTNNGVYFMDGWIEYDRRQEYMLDANVAIYCDKESLETEFSHRTRVLDHIWLELPTICSKGDYFSEIIDSKGLGIVTNRAEKDFSEAILQLYEQKDYISKIKGNIKKVKKDYTWDITLLAIVDYVKYYKPTNSILQQNRKVKFLSRAKRKIIRLARAGLDRFE